MRGAGAMSGGGGGGGMGGFGNLGKAMTKNFVTKTQL
jgi:hypothetical protein